MPAGAGWQGQMLAFFFYGFSLDPGASASGRGPEGDDNRRERKERKDQN